MRYPCKLIRPGQPDEEFPAVAFLADRIHTLRALRPVSTVQGVITDGVFSAACVTVRLHQDDGAGEVLGHALIGKPELAGLLQDQLLHGALYRLDPEAELPEAFAQFRRGAT